MKTQSKEKNTQPLIISSRDDLSVCPLCKGSGFVLVTRVTEESQRIYGKDVALDYAEPCPACNGGFADRVETSKKLADIPESFTDKPFTAFKWDIYKDDKGFTVNLSEQKKFIESFINDFEKWSENGLGLYLWSRVKGSGKTFLASTICNELMNRYAIRTKFVSASNLINIAQSGDRNSHDRYERDPISLLCECKVLVLDDLGQKVSGNQWIGDILFQILDERMQSKLVTLITSNVRLSELNFDDRIVDRLNKMCQPIPLPNYCVRAKESNDMKRNLFKELGLMA